MSPYATTLAHARLDALRKLIAALNEADTPEEKRRCAVAIFNAPDPSDLDDELQDDAEESDELLDEYESADERTPTTSSQPASLRSASSVPSNSSPTPAPSQPPLDTSTSDIPHPPPDIESRLRASELRQLAQMQHLAAQLAAPSIPVS